MVRERISILQVIGFGPKINIGLLNRIVHPWLRLAEIIAPTTCEMLWPTASQLTYN